MSRKLSAVDEWLNANGMGKDFTSQPLRPIITEGMDVANLPSIEEPTSVVLNNVDLRQSVANDIKKKEDEERSKPNSGN